VFARETIPVTFSVSTEMFRLLTVALARRAILVNELFALIVVLPVTVVIPGTTVGLPASSSHVGIR